MSGEVAAPAAVPAWTQALATLLAGTGFGLVVVVLNHAESVIPRTLSLVTGGGAGWATFGILVAAWWRRRLVLSVAGALVALAAAVTSYYVADAVAADSPLSLDFADMRWWTVAALVVAGPVGVVGWRARRDGTWPGLLAMIVAPVGFAAESAIYLQGFEWLSPWERATRVTIVAVAVAVVMLMVVRKIARPVDRAHGPTS